MILDASAVRAEAAALDLGDVVFLPVRHHSPACAWHVRKTIRERRPSAVLVEGPHDFAHLIDAVLHERTRAPIAIYTYAVASKNERYSAYYPFCDYSPELVALREGRASGAELAFIDLSFAEQRAATIIASGDREAAADVPGRPGSLMEERWAQRSAYLDALAARLGCRDHDELWDHAFEANARSLQSVEFFAGVYAYCKTARADRRQDEDERDATPARERAMAARVIAARMRRAERGEAGPIVVVTGGYHSVALPDLVRDGTSPETIDATRFAERFSALVRFGFERLDRLNGYGSGMPAPAYYQRSWEAVGGDVRAADSVALGVLLDVAQELRRDHGGISTASVITALEQTRALARLRGREGATREDVLDGIRSTFVKGAIDAEGASVLARTRLLMTGSALGTVPPGAGVPPLVGDVERRLRTARLKIDDSLSHDLSLDLYRRPEHRTTSRLLHAIGFLNAPFASKTGGPDFVRGSRLGRLHERWRYAYGAATEAALVEAAMYGSTLPEATAARFEERLAQLASTGEGRDASAAVRALSEACVLGLQGFVPQLARGLREAIAADASFVSLVDAASGIALLGEAREPLEAGGLEDLPAMLATAYERAIFLAMGLPQTPEDDAPAVLEALLKLGALAAAHGAELDGELFTQCLLPVLASPEAPLLAGAAAGLCAQRGVLDEPGLVALLAGGLHAVAGPAAGITFLRGLLRAAREVAWQQQAIVETIDETLRAWRPDEFLRALPELRLAFSEMTPRETARIAERVAARYGGEPLDLSPVPSVTERDVLANLEIDAGVLAELERDGLLGWLST